MRHDINGCMGLFKGLNKAQITKKYWQRYFKADFKAKKGEE